MNTVPSSLRGWLSRLRVAKLFAKARQAEADVVSRLGRGGYFFIATSDEVMAIDLSAGPKQPIRLSPSRTAPAPVPEIEIPHLYDPSFLDLVVSAVLRDEKRLQPVRETRQVVLYRFPEQATSALSELTPQRADVCAATISAIADQIMLRKEVSDRFKKSGVESAVLIIRGHALRATPRNQGKELYYWFWCEK